MPTLRVHDANRWSSLSEDAEVIASYQANTQLVRLAVSGSGERSAVVLLNPDDAKALINELMAAVHEHKVATKRRQPAPTLLRKQSNKPRSIPTTG